MGDLPVAFAEIGQGALAARANAIRFPLASVLVMLAPPIHMYRQLRGTYGTSVAGTLWRTAALRLFAIVVVAIFALLLLSVELSDWSDRRRLAPLVDHRCAL